MTIVPADLDARVLLVGAHGHGRWHLANLRRLEQAGGIRLTAVCDTRPAPAELTSGLPFDDDLAGLLAATQPDVTIICTPIHTHAGLALTAMRAGSHVLLEKPPAATFADYQRIIEGSREHDRACQVGFQDLGSQALAAIRALIDNDAIGQVRGMGAACAWVRGADYFARAPWAGRRALDGAPVVDGALTNPFAHATASALAIAHAQEAGSLVDLEIELYRANRIEADDTSCLRVHTRDGTVITVAATLCAAVNAEPYLIVHGSKGRIILKYKGGEVRLENESGVQTSTYPRTDLLENLVAHVNGRAELLVPPEAVGSFMEVLEAVRLAPEPRPIEPAYLREGDERTVVEGVDEAVKEAAQSFATFSELGMPWASPSHVDVNYADAGALGNTEAN